MDPLLNVDQAREYLGGIGRSLLFELLRSGELRSVRIGRRRMIPASELARYIDSRMMDAER